MPEIGFFIVKNCNQGNKIANNSLMKFSFLQIQILIRYEIKKHLNIKINV